MIEEHPWLRVRHRLFGEKPIVELMRSGEIDLVLCGHVHKPGLKVDADGRGQCCAGSVTRNGSLTEIESDVENRRFRFREVAL